MIAQAAHFLYFDEVATTPSDLLNGCSKMMEASRKKYTSGPPFVQSSRPTKKYTNNKSPHMSGKPLSSFPSPTKTKSNEPKDEL